MNYVIALLLDASWRLHMITVPGMVIYAVIEVIKDLGWRNRTWLRYRIKLWWHADVEDRDA